MIANFVVHGLVHKLRNKFNKYEQNGLEQSKNKI
jgi:hypothetical protein